MMQEMGVVNLVLYILGGVLVLIPVILAISFLWGSPEAADRDRPETRIPTTDETSLKRPVRGDMA